MMHLILMVQLVNIEEKLKNAPDSGYETGLIIGSFIPFIVLMGLAYWMYNHFKKAKRNE